MNIYALVPKKSKEHSSVLQDTYCNIPNYEYESFSNLNVIWHEFGKTCLKAATT